MGEAEGSPAGQALIALAWGHVEVTEIGAVRAEQCERGRFGIAADGTEPGGHGERTETGGRVTCVQVVGAAVEASQANGPGSEERPVAGARLGAVAPSAESRLGGWAERTATMML